MTSIQAHQPCIQVNMQANQAFRHSQMPRNWALKQSSAKERQTNNLTGSTGF